MGTCLYILQSSSHPFLEGAERVRVLHLADLRCEAPEKGCCLLCGRLESTLRLLVTASRGFN